MKNHYLPHEIVKTPIISTLKRTILSVGTEGYPGFLKPETYRCSTPRNVTYNGGDTIQDYSGLNPPLLTPGTRSIRREKTFLIHFIP